MVVNQLLSLGLSQKEAEIYVANMQLGLATVQQIADKAEVNRTTVYTHVRNMIRRGLISTRQKGDRYFYVAEKPEKLKSIWQKQEDEIKRRKETLDKVMPELESLYNLAAQRPSVRLYDMNEISKLRDHILNQRSNELLNIFNYELFKEFISATHVKQLIDSTQKFKVLYVAENKILDRKLHKFLKDDRFKIKYLPYNKFNFLCEILIADKEVYINRENDSLVINDPIFSKTFKIVFNVLWQIAEEF